MIKVFGQLDKTFSSNGDIIIKPLKAKVHKEDNSDSYLDLECGLEYIDNLVEGNILVAPLPQGEQAFRVGNVQKTSKKLSTKAKHVFYDSKNYAIADTNVVDKNCNDALTQINNRTDTTSPFVTYSDITTIASTRIVRKSLYEALSIVLEHWGGHIVRNNFFIQVLSSIGQDNGVTVRYRKNLESISCEDNWDNVVTKILPVGRDGTLLNAVDPSASIYISSATQYPLPYTKVVEFEQDIDQEDYPSESAYIQALVNDLRIQAQSYLDENCIPKVNYTLKANLDKVTDIGDTIEVIDERLGVDIMTQVIAFDYDCILEKFTEIEFGNYQRKLSDLIGTITAQANTTSKEMVQGATDEIWTTLGGSYVIFEGDKLLVIDALPKEDAHNVIKIDSGGIKYSQDGILGVFSTLLDIDDGTLKPKNNEELDDYIILTGSTDGWDWAKYSSGACELWSKLTFNSSSITWDTFATDFKTGTASMTYPFNVTDAIINATIDTCDSNIGWIAQAKATATSGGSLVIVRDGNTGTITVNVHIKGSWR
jgi:phage minor structural protein